MRFPSGIDKNWLLALICSIPSVTSSLWMAACLIPARKTKLNIIWVSSNLSSIIYLDSWWLFKIFATYRISRCNDKLTVTSNFSDANSVMFSNAGYSFYHELFVRRHKVLLQSHIFVLLNVKNDYLTRCKLNEQT